MENSTGTRQKALALNLDAKTYGTFAEIGAGQEVARWFFSVGGAAGTVAKTISAYTGTRIGFCHVIAVHRCTGGKGCAGATGPHPSSFILHRSSRHGW